MFAGGLFALVIPTLSVLLAQQIGVQPFFVGGFFVAMALTSIIFGQAVGNWSDKLGDRRQILMLGMISGSLACIAFALSSSYIVIFLAGLTFLSFSLASTSQMLALTREYADQFLHPKHCTLFNSIVRASIAMAWVGGPPLGFFMYSSLGSTDHYLIVALLYFIVGIAVLVSLPKTERAPPSSKQPVENRNRTLIVALVAFALLYGCNHAYIISLPLFLPEAFSIPSEKAGWIMGTAAGLEAPTMILAGWLSSRLPLMLMIRIGAFSSVLLYTGFYFASELWQLFCLQIFNAIFIGTLAGLGMTWFQNMLPGKTGAASAMFVNTMSAGNVIGSVIVLA